MPSKFDFLIVGAGFAGSVLAERITTAIVLITGIWYFRKTERTFADVI